MLPRLLLLLLPLLLSAGLAAGKAAVPSSRAYWRGTRQAKYCKICLYLADRILQEHAARQQATATGAASETVLQGEGPGWPHSKSESRDMLDGFCVSGKPRKGAAVLAYFDSPPSGTTWNEVGRYCVEASSRLEHTAITVWLNSLDNGNRTAEFTAYKHICSKLNGGHCNEHDLPKRSLPAAATYAADGTELSRLEQEKSAAVKAENYELAAQLRDRIAALLQPRDEL